MNTLPASKISKTTGLASWCMRNLLKQYVSKLHSSQCSTTKSQNIPHPKSLCPRNVHRTKIMSSTRNYACFGKLYLQGHTLLRGKSSQQPLFCYCARHFLNESKKDVHRKRTTLIYVCAVGVFMVGMSYAGVPLYRIFCQTTGLGGQAVRGHDAPNIETMPRVQDRTIRVRFNADVASSMRWNFHPQQVDVKVFPGETALAFYTAKNPTDKPIIGISTYNVLPFEAGQYFNKIQCFCFEEQRLNPHEQVDMPVFFYIDPEFAMDPKMEQVDTITLSYTFFEAKEGLKLPLPGYATS